MLSASRREIKTERHCICSNISISNIKYRQSSTAIHTPCAESRPQLVCRRRWRATAATRGELQDQAMASRRRRPRPEGGVRRLQRPASPLQQNSEQRLEKGNDPAAYLAAEGRSDPAGYLAASRSCRVAAPNSRFEILAMVPFGVSIVAYHCGTLCWRRPSSSRSSSTETEADASR